MLKTTKISVTEKQLLKIQEEILNAPLRDFLNEAEKLGYTFFCKDIIKKVIIARLSQKL
tara:strand:- start:476 stop:652 length:177 start_codon:yes stop_codon:yes gene_type:complete